MASIFTHFKLDKLEKFRRRQQPVEAEAEEDREVGVYCLVLAGGGRKGRGNERREGRREDRGRECAMESWTNIPSMCYMCVHNLGNRSVRTCTLC